MPVYYEMQSQPYRCFPMERLRANVHLHKQAELIYVHAGELSVFLQGEEYLLHTGELALVFPNVIHGYLHFADNRSQLLICGSEMAGDFAGKLHRYTCVRPILRAEEVHRDVVHCLRALDEGSFQSDGARRLDPALAKGYISLIIGRVLERMMLEKAPPNNAEPAISRMLSYIEEHYTESITITQVASAIGANRQHLSRLFSQKLHIGFNDYVNSLRVELARRLLLNPDLTVLDVAFESGFDSQRTFNRAYKAIYGEPPSSFRRRELEVDMD